MEKEIITDCPPPFLCCEQMRADTSQRWNDVGEKERELKDTIIQVTRDEKPETVHQLVDLVRQRLSRPEKQIREAILSLQNEGRLRLLFPARQPSRGPVGYMRTNNALWYWITLILTLATVVAVFTVPDDAFPLVYARYVLGVTFVLWLPGYSFMKALFPAQLPIRTSDKSLNTIERMALSFGLSLALVPLDGLLLNYTPWGITLTPITLSLAVITLTFATAGLIREYHAKKV